MTECREQSWLFQDLGNRKVEVDFGGGYLSSDGGGLILLKHLRAPYRNRSDYRNNRDIV
jgi:hypothetical protein